MFIFRQSTNIISEGLIRYTVKPGFVSFLTFLSVFEEMLNIEIFCVCTGPTELCGRFRVVTDDRTADLTVVHFVFILHSVSKSSPDRPATTDQLRQMTTGYSTHGWITQRAYRAQAQGPKGLREGGGWRVEGRPLSQSEVTVFNFGVSNTEGMSTTFSLKM